MQGSYPFEKLKQLISKVPDDVLLEFGSGVTEGVLDIYQALAPENTLPKQAIEMVQAGAQDEALLQLANQLMGMHIRYKDTPPMRLSEDKNPAYQWAFHVSVGHLKSGTFHVVMASYNLKRLYAWMQHDAAEYARLAEKEYLEQWQYMGRLMKAHTGDSNYP